MGILGDTAVRVHRTGRLLTGLLATRLFGRPLLLSHLVTCRCPCRCQTCLWRGLVSEEMTADEIRPIYRDAAAIGCRINSIWGGEPLVRQDLPEILSHSHAAGLNTILITNGQYLPDRAGELAAHLTGVILSLDHPSPRHDELRGMPGLFEAVVTSIELRPNGDLMDCLDRSQPVANVRTTSLASLLRRPDIHRRRMARTTCQVCNNANVIDCSYVWQLRPESVLSLVRAHLRW